MNQGTTTTTAVMTPASIVQAYLVIAGLFTLSASVTGASTPYSCWTPGWCT